ncbi:hypothetical protein Pcinc_028136 [Petrolisthes cinctipes]|uniref:Uncharacterized protein n=1 Tax=Petrolisthes cinctipes TaxID=88211 RepID=A0AAE1F498_PETCI|nr:hypothetical protein Pcinc_028136 [Petrolisthes cinctipes]
MVEEGRGGEGLEPLERNEGKEKLEMKALTREKMKTKAGPLGGDLMKGSRAGEKDQGAGLCIGTDGGVCSAGQDRTRKVKLLTMHRRNHHLTYHLTHPATAPYSTTAADSQKRNVNQFSPPKRTFVHQLITSSLPPLQLRSREGATD